MEALDQVSTLSVIRNAPRLADMMVLLGLMAACAEQPPAEDESTVPAETAGLDGQQIFRFETFGGEPFWTDTLRIHEVVQTAVDPETALSVGLKVDADALTPGVLESADLASPATTLALLKLDAIVGLMGEVTTVGGRDTLVRVAITCALCHSTVDNSVQPGIGRRLDGWPNRDLDVGAIVALSPALSPEQKAVYSSWGPGRYDPRYNQDGQNSSVLIPPAYGLAGVETSTYTGDGDVSYWNNYVAVTQMHGHGTFVDPRIGIDLVRDPDLVGPKLPALLDYQLSLMKPAPPSGSFDSAAAERGRAVFADAGRCASCHAGVTFTSATLHAPSETGVDPLTATRSATGKYRATPLRALWQHPPYFHDGGAATLWDVVEHYNRILSLGFTESQKNDLVEYLKSL